VANVPIHVDTCFSWLCLKENWHRVGGRVTDYPSKNKVHPVFKSYGLENAFWLGVDLF
jgi:hypothetical protein